MFINNTELSYGYIRSGDFVVIHAEHIHVQLNDDIDCYLAYLYLDEIGTKRISLKGRFMADSNGGLVLAKKSYTLSMQHIDEDKIIKLGDEFFERFYECLTENERRSVPPSIAILRKKEFLDEYRDPNAMDIIYVYDSFHRQRVKVLYKEIVSSRCLVGVVYGNDNPLKANTVVNVVLTRDDYNYPILIIK